MPYGILLTIFDVVLVVHAAKTGRFWPWAYVIILLPGIGGIAYIVAELAPSWLGSYKARQTGKQIATALNPLGRYRQLHDDLALVDTIANRAALAEESLRLEKYDEARALYASILNLPLGDEPAYLLGRARAEFGCGEPGVALASLEELKARWPDQLKTDSGLLRAMALEAVGRNDEAVAAYDDVGRFYPGAEPRVRQAQLLSRLGRHQEARALADDIVRTLNRAPAYVRRSQRDWLSAAKALAKG